MNNKLNTKKQHKKSYAHKIYTLFIIISAICTAISTIVLSSFFVNIIYNNDKQYSINSLNNIKLQLEKITDKVNTSAIQISLNPYVSKYCASNLNINYLEIQNILDIINTTYSSLSQNLDSIYVVYPHHNLTITSYGCFSWDSFIDKTWHNYSNKNLFIKPHKILKTGTIGKQNPTNVISKIFPISINNNMHNSSFIVFNIKIDTIQEIISSSTTTNSDIIITSNNNEIIYENLNKNYINIRNEIINNPNKKLIYKNNTLYRITSLSKNNNINYFMYSSITDLYKTTIFGILMVIITSIFTLLIGIYFSKKFKQYAYKPLNQLLKNIATENNTYSPVNYTEFNTIYNHINNFKNENIKLNQKFLLEIPNLNENLLKDLLCGNYIDSSDIINRIKYLNADIDDIKFFYVSVIRLIDIETQSFELTQTKEELQILINFSIFQHLKNICTNYDMFFHKAGSNKNDLYFVLGFSKLEYSEEILYKIHNKLLNYSKNALNSNILIAISDCVCEITDINICYNQAMQVIEQNLLYGKSNIEFYRKDFDLEKSNYFNPLYYEKQLSHSILNSEYIQINKIFDIILNNLKTSNLNIHTLRQIYISICNIVFLLYNKNLNEEINSNYFYKTIYKLCEIEKLDELHKYTLNICLETSKKFEENNNLKNKKLSDDIFNFIKNNFDKDISLDDISTTFSRTAQHINKILKIYYNKTFYDLLTDIRINESIDLLLNSDIKINNIALKVGYTNTQSFIRMFKKILGVTPGQYREKNIGNKIHKN